MNIHKNAGLTFIRRVETVEDVLKNGLPAAQASQLYGVSAATIRKWVGRFLARGRPALADRSSLPAYSPRAIDGAEALTIVELRKKRMTQARIAQYFSLSKATVSRVLTRAGLGAPIGPRAGQASTTIRTRAAPRPDSHLHEETERIERQGIVLPGIVVAVAAAPTGKSCLSPLMTMRVSRTPSCIQTSPKKALAASWPTPMRITARWAPSPGHF